MDRVTMQSTQWIIHEGPFFKTDAEAKKSAEEWCLENECEYTGKHKRQKNKDGVFESLFEVNKLATFTNSFKGSVIPTCSPKVGRKSCVASSDLPISYMCNDTDSYVMSEV